MPRKSAGGGWNNNFVEPKGPNGTPFLPGDAGAQAGGRRQAKTHEELDMRGEGAHLLSKHSEGLRTIYLSRPTTLNALDASTVTKLRQKLEALDENPAVTTIVIKGRQERVFCSGTDYKMLWDAAKGDSAARKRVIEYLREEYALQWLVHTMTKPVVVIGHGVTASTGYAMAANAGFGYATESTRVIVPEVSLGLVPSGGASYHLARSRSGAGMFAALTALPVSGEVAYWGGMIPYATTYDLAEGLLQEQGGRLGSTPLAAADVWADPQYRKALQAMRAGMAEEKSEWMRRLAERASDPIAFDRLIDLEMWHKATRAGRPDIAAELAEGAIEGDEPDYEVLFPGSLEEMEDEGLHLGLGIDWFESKELHGWEGVPVPEEAHRLAMHDEAGTLAASLAARYDALPAAPSREAMHQLRAIERCFGGAVGLGDPVLAVRDDVRPARGGGSFLQPPPDAAREAVDGATRARLAAVAEAELFDSEAGRRAGLVHGVSPAEEAVRQRWRRVADRAARPEYWRERAAAKAGLTVTPPRPDQVQPGSPQSGLARISGSPAPLPADWESRIGRVEGRAEGRPAGVHATVLAAHEALGLPARRVMPASRAGEAGSAEAARRAEELRLREAVDAAVREGVQRAWPLGWMPAHTTAEACARAGCPADPDTRAVVRFATAVATARLHGQPDLALVPRQHWEAQRAEELRRKLAPGRMSERQWGRLGEQFPFLLEHLMGILPPSETIGMHINAIRKDANTAVTAELRAEADASVRHLVREAARRGVPLRGPSAELADKLGLGHLPGVRLFAADGAPLNAAARAEHAGHASLSTADEAAAAAAAAPPFAGVDAGIIRLLDPAADAPSYAAQALSGVSDTSAGLTQEQVRELRGLRARLAAAIRRVEADRNLQVHEAAEQRVAEGRLARQQQAAQRQQQQEAAMSEDSIAALEAEEASAVADAEGRALPAPLPRAELERLIEEVAGIRGRIQELWALQVDAVAARRASLLGARAEVGPAGVLLEREAIDQLKRDGARAQGASAIGELETQLEEQARPATRRRGLATEGPAEHVARRRTEEGFVPGALSSTAVLPGARVADEAAAAARAMRVADGTATAADLEAARLTDGATLEELVPSLVAAPDRRVRPRDLDHVAGAAHDAVERLGEAGVDRLGRPLPLDPAGPDPTATDVTAAMDDDEMEEHLTEMHAFETLASPINAAAHAAEEAEDRTPFAMDLDEMELDSDLTTTMGDYLDPTEPAGHGGGLARNAYTRNSELRELIEAPVDPEWTPSMGDPADWMTPPEFFDPAMSEAHNFALEPHREPLARLGRYDPLDPATDDGFAAPGRLGISLARAEEGIAPRAVRFSAGDPAPRRREPLLSSAMSAALGLGGAPKDRALASAQRLRQSARAMRRWVGKLRAEERARFEAMLPETPELGRPKDADGNHVPRVHTDLGSTDNPAELLAQMMQLVKAVNQTMPATAYAVRPMAQLGLATRLEREEQRSRSLFDAGAADREHFARAADELGLPEEAAAARSIQYTPLFPDATVGRIAAQHGEAVGSRVHSGLALARALLGDTLPDGLSAPVVDPGDAMRAAGLAPAPVPAGADVFDVPAAGSWGGGGAGHAGGGSSAPAPSPALAAGDAAPADAYAYAPAALPDIHSQSASLAVEGAAEVPSTGLPATFADVPGFAVLDDRKRKLHAARLLREEGAVFSGVSRHSGLAVPSESAASVHGAAGEVFKGGLAAEAPVRSSLVAHHGSQGLFAQGDGVFAPWASGGDWRGAANVDRRPKRSKAHMPGSRSTELAGKVWVDEAWSANQYTHGRVILGGSREQAARERIVDKATDALAVYEAARVTGGEEVARSTLQTLLQSLALDLDPLVQAARSMVGVSGMAYPTLEAHDQALLAVRAAERAAHRADAFGEPGAPAAAAELPPSAQGSIDLAYYAKEARAQEQAAAPSAAGAGARPSHEGGVSGPADVPRLAVASPPDADGQLVADRQLVPLLPGEAAASLPDAPLHVRDPSHGGKGTDATVAETAEVLRSIASARTHEVLSAAGLSLEAVVRAALRREGMREAIAAGAASVDVQAARDVLAEMYASGGSQDASFLDPAMDVAMRGGKRAPHINAASRSLFGPSSLDASAGAQAADGPPLADVIGGALGAPVRTPNSAARSGGISGAAASVAAVDAAADAANVALEADGLPPVNMTEPDPLTGETTPHRADELSASLLAHDEWLDRYGFSKTPQEAREAAADAEAALSSEALEDIRAELMQSVLELEAEGNVALTPAQRTDMVEEALRSTEYHGVEDGARAVDSQAMDADGHYGALTDATDLSAQRVVVDDAHLALPVPQQVVHESQVRALKAIAYGPAALRLYGEEMAATTPNLASSLGQMEPLGDRELEAAARGTPGGVGLAAHIPGWASTRVRELAEQALDARLLGRPDLAELKDAERQAFAETAGVADPGPLTVDAWLADADNVETVVRGQLQQREGAMRRQAEAQEHVSRTGQAPDWADAELRARLIGVRPEVAQRAGQMRASLRQLADLRTASSLQIHPDLPAAEGVARLAAQYDEIVRHYRPDAAPEVAFTERDKDELLERLQCAIVAQCRAAEEVAPEVRADELHEALRREAAALAKVPPPRSGGTVAKGAQQASLDADPSVAEAAAVAKQRETDALKTGDDEARRTARADVSAAATAADAVMSGTGSVLDEAVVAAFKATALSAPARATARLLVAESRQAEAWLEERLAGGSATGGEPETMAALTRLATARAGLRAVVRNDQGVMAAWLEAWQAQRRAAAAAAGASVEEVMAAEAAAAAAESGRSVAAEAAWQDGAHTGAGSFGAPDSSRLQGLRAAADPEEEARRRAIELGLRQSALDSTPALEKPGLGFAKARLEDPPLSAEEVIARLEARELAGNDELAHVATASEGRLARGERQERAPDGTPILISEEAYAEAAALDVAPSIADALAGDLELRRRPLAALGVHVRPPSTRGPATLDDELAMDAMQNLSLSEVDASSTRFDFHGDLAQASTQGGSQDILAAGAAGADTLAQAEGAITARTAAGAGLQLLHQIARSQQAAADKGGQILALGRVDDADGPDGAAMDRMAARLEPARPSWVRPPAPAAEQLERGVVSHPAASPQQVSAALIASASSNAPWAERAAEGIRLGIRQSAAAGTAASAPAQSEAGAAWSNHTPANSPVAFARALASGAVEAADGSGMALPRPTVTLPLAKTLWTNSAAPAAQPRSQPPSAAATGGAGAGAGAGAGVAEPSSAAAALRAHVEEHSVEEALRGALARERSRVAADLEAHVRAMRIQEARFAAGDRSALLPGVSTWEPAAGADGALAPGAFGAGLPEAAAPEPVEAGDSTAPTRVALELLAAVELAAGAHAEAAGAVVVPERRGAALALAQRAIAAAGTHLPEVRAKMELLAAEAGADDAVVQLAAAAASTVLQAVAAGTDTAATAQLGTAEASGEPGLPFAPGAFSASPAVRGTQALLHQLWGTPLFASPSSGPAQGPLAGRYAGAGREALARPTAHASAGGPGEGGSPIGSAISAAREKLPVDRHDPAVAAAISPGAAAVPVEEIAAQAVASGLARARAHLAALPPRRTEDPAVPPRVEQDLGAAAGSIGQLRAAAKLMQAAGELPEDQAFVADGLDAGLPADMAMAVGLPTPAPRPLALDPAVDDVDAAVEAEDAGALGLEAVLRMGQGAEAHMAEAAAAHAGLASWAAREPAAREALAKRSPDAPQLLAELAERGAELAALRALELRSQRRRRAKQQERLAMAMADAAGVSFAPTPPSAADAAVSLADAAVAGVWNSAQGRLDALAPSAPESQRVAIRLEAAAQAAALRSSVLAEAATARAPLAVPLTGGLQPWHNEASTALRTGLTSEELARRVAELSEWARLRALVGDAAGPEPAEARRAATDGDTAASRIFNPARADVLAGMVDGIAAAEMELEAVAELGGRRGAWAAVLLNEMRSRHNPAVMGSASAAMWTLPGRIALARLYGDDAARALSVRPSDAARVEALLRRDGLVPPADTAREEAIDAAAEASMGELAAEPPVVRAAYAAICRTIRGLGGPTRDLNPAAGAVPGLRVGLGEQRFPGAPGSGFGSSVAEREVAARKLERQRRERQAAVAEIVRRRVMRAAAAQDEGTAAAASAGTALPGSPPVPASSAAASALPPAPAPRELQLLGEAEPLGPRPGSEQMVAVGTMDAAADSWQSHPDLFRRFAPTPSARQLAQLGLLGREEARVRGLLIEQGARRPGHAYSAPPRERVKAADLEAGEEALKHSSPAVQAAAKQRREAFAALLEAGEYWRFHDAVAAQEWESLPPHQAAELASRSASSNSRRGEAALRTLQSLGAAARVRIGLEDVEAGHPGLRPGGVLDKLGRAAMATAPRLVPAPLLRVADEAEIEAVIREQRAARGPEAVAELVAEVQAEQDAALLAEAERRRDGEVLATAEAAQLAVANGTDPLGRSWTLVPGDDPVAQAEVERVRSSLMPPTAYAASNPHVARIRQGDVDFTDPVQERLRRTATAAIGEELFSNMTASAALSARASAARQVAAISAALDAQRAGNEPAMVAAARRAAERADAMLSGRPAALRASGTTSAATPVEAATAAAQGAGEPVSSFTVAGVLPVWAEVGGLAGISNPDHAADHPEVLRRRAARLADAHERLVRGRDSRAAGTGWADVVDANRTESDKAAIQEVLAAQTGRVDATTELSDAAKARITHEPDQLLHALGMPLEPRTEQAARAVTDRFSAMDAWRTAVPLPRSVGEIERRLEAEDTPFARDALRAIRRNPTAAVQATHRLLVESGRSSLARAMQMEWRVNHRLRQRDDFATAGDATVMDGDAASARDLLPGLSDAELDELFRPLAPREELVLGRREHLAHRQRTEKVMSEWRAKQLDALERGEGDGYLGELFRRRYDYVYDPDDHVFDVNHDYEAEKRMVGRDEAQRRGFVDAAAAKQLLAKGYPAAQQELSAFVHPRVMAKAGIAHGYVDENTGDIVEPENALRDMAATATSLATSGALDPTIGASEIAQQLHMVDADGNLLVDAVGEEQRA